MRSGPALPGERAPGRSLRTWVLPQAWGLVDFPLLFCYMARQGGTGARRLRGQAIKRIALLLGNNLIVSDGKFWKKQRRMMQPAFLPNAIGALTGMIASVP